MTILKLTGKESTLTLHLEHPIHLDDYGGGESKIALLGFYSENHFINLRENSCIYFWGVFDLESNDLDSDSNSNLDDNAKCLNFQKGYWTLNTIQKECRLFIKSLNLGVDENKFEIEKLDNMKIRITSPLKFYLEKSVCKLLGFNNSCVKFDKNNTSLYFEASKNIVGDSAMNLSPLDVVELHCNIIESSFVNHDIHSHKHLETSILYQFYPNVEYNHKISEVPFEKLYIPVQKGVRKIQSITITIMDGKNQLVENPNVNNIVYLDLKLK